MATTHLSTSLHERLRDETRRFWTFVHKTGPNAHDCWLWTGARDKRGYGQFGSRVFGGHRASRFAWAITHHQKVPDGLFVCHHCDVPACVRPSHLYAGTQVDNKRDEYARGRQPCFVGAQNNLAKLSDEAIIDIRNSRLSGAELAKQHGMSQSSISRIRRGIDWAHLGGALTVETRFKASGGSGVRPVVYRSKGKGSRGGPV